MNNITLANNSSRTSMRHGGISAGQYTQHVSSGADLLDMSTRQVNFQVLTDDVMGTGLGVYSTDKKMLIKGYDKENPAQYMSVVNKSYRVVENREILHPLHEQMVNFFDPLVLNDVQVKDTVTKNYTKCYSEYSFPKVSRPIETRNGHKTDFQFRVIVKNTFDGSGSAVLWCGSIDMFCMNGRISGEFDVAKARHSRNFTADGFMVILQKSLERFNNEMALYQEYADKKLKAVKPVEDLYKALTAGSSEVKESKRADTLSDRLFAQYGQESAVRGHNLFSVMSALTHYASHDDERFGLKSNATADSLYKRQEKVSSWLNSKTWQEFVKEAVLA